jgi:prepilin-type N-terminal cleavage/methylation domain-containing protein
MQRNAQRGFSLIEFMIAIVLLLAMMATVFQLINLAIARSGTEQARLDMFQESREFMDQMSRDLHQAGYPNTHGVSPTLLTASPVSSDLRTAVGLVKVDSGDLWFEGDVDGTGMVYSVQYHLDTSTTNGCPCLKRSQVQKKTGNPLTGQDPAVYNVEVQGVQNTNIFSAFLHSATGTPVTLPIDFNSNASTIANIDTVEAVVTIKSTHMDSQTRTYPSASLITTVRLNNCSQADKGQDMSCE